MKKSIIILSAMTLIAFTSCNERGDKVETKDEVTTVQEGTETPEETVATTENVDTPDFDNAELQEYMDAYDAYIEEYKEAMTSKDPAKIQALTEKGNELGQKAQGFTELSEGDAAKLSEYMQAKAKEMQDIAMQAAGN